MKHITIGLSAFVVGLLAAVGTSSAQDRSADERRKLILPQVRAATDCVTTGVKGRLPAPGNQASKQQVQNAIDAVLTAQGCDEPIKDMIRQHDRVFGQGSGIAFFRGAYLDDLPRAVTSRLRAPGTTPASAVPSPTQATSQTAPMATLAVSHPVAQPSSPPGLATPSSVKSYVPTKLDEEAFRRYLSLGLAIMGGCTFILFVLGCGSRVVVFASPADLGMSACMFVVPFATFLISIPIALFLGPKGTNNYNSIIDIGHDNPALGFVELIGVIVWVWSVLGTIFSSMKHNGFMIGLLVAAMKIGAMLLISLTWFGASHNDEVPSERDHTLAKLIMFGLVIWFASKFINGPRVYERRVMIFGASTRTATSIN
ncbi:hypothetical protein [uncultured Methylobacterium sp.]|jgi:hypothetical protein|uniref:hypothetical protein n=1 Tax=uncultured Methylobacterium sp. TaxID=157278 RepID=UPI00260F7920|nr:hypothetical protein [uncultured Methylobacterium sp.]